MSICWVNTGFSHQNSEFGICKILGNILVGNKIDHSELIAMILRLWGENPSLLFGVVPRTISFLLLLRLLNAWNWWNWTIKCLLCLICHWRYRVTQRHSCLFYLHVWILLTNKIKSEGITYSCQFFCYVDIKKYFKKTKTNIYYHHFPKEGMYFTIKMKQGSNLRINEVLSKRGWLVVLHGCFLHGQMNILPRTLINSCIVS